MKRFILSFCIIAAAATPSRAASLLEPGEGLITLDPARAFALVTQIAQVRKTKRRAARRGRRTARPRINEDEEDLYAWRKRKCNPQKYHGPGAVITYDPDNFDYTPEYLDYRDPDQQSREQAARAAEKRFPELVTPKVLKMLRLANEVRRRRGHTLMRLEPRLMLAAKRHNLDIAKHGLMQHTGTDCSQLKDRVWDAGYIWTSIAENLAGGFETAEQTMAQWTGSKRHLMQLTLPYMTEVGIAYDANPHPPRRGLPLKHYWTLILGRPDPWRDHKFKEELDGIKDDGYPKGHPNAGDNRGSSTKGNKAE